MSGADVTYTSDQIQSKRRYISYVRRRRSARSTSEMDSVFQRRVGDRVRRVADRVQPVHPRRQHDEPSARELRLVQTGVDQPLPRGGLRHPVPQQNRLTVGESDGGIVQDRTLLSQLHELPPDVPQEGGAHVVRTCGVHASQVLLPRLFPVPDAGEGRGGQQELAPVFPTLHVRRRHEQHAQDFRRLSAYDTTDTSRQVRHTDARYVTTGAVRMRRCTVLSFTGWGGGGGGPAIAQRGRLHNSTHITHIF